MDEQTDSAKMCPMCGDHPHKPYRILAMDDASVGGAHANALFFEHDNVSWGWGQWLAMPWAPMLLMQTVVSVGGSGIAFQAKQLLGERYLRLAPPLPYTMAADMARIITGFTDKIFEQADVPADGWAEGQLGIDCRPNFYWTSRWIDEQWFQGTHPVEVDDEGRVVPMKTKAP